MAQFDNLKLYSEYPTMLSGKRPLRIYTSGFREGKVRWHFGFQESMVKPVRQLLETTPFWGEQHWTEQDGFWVYWTTCCTPEGEFPQKELILLLDTLYLSGYNNVVAMFRKWAKKE